MDIYEQVYYSMLGMLNPEERLPWVENAFREGDYCDREYEDMRNAYERIVERLEEVDEDEDLEVIVDALTHIQMELCRRSFELGMRYILEKHYLPEQCSGEIR